ncbi:unnamed protein product [Dracunculus medinensis]|uniref:Glycosyl transferase n=1 Tax=Dracunculus medinensis TaxID=318479 RepID=A0A0N4UAC9_DRAME|nr:unnamed protein product [Dracunculus medinensis]
MNEYSHIFHTLNRPTYKAEGEFWLIHPVLWRLLTANPTKRILNVWFLFGQNGISRCFHRWLQRKAQSVVPMQFSIFAVFQFYYFMRAFPLFSVDLW